MKLLLTSAGIKNPSIQSALVDLLGKPISEASALCIPTAMYGHPWVGPGEKAWQFISGQEPNCPMCELGWESLGVLELTALPSIDEERWVPLVQETDVLLAAGGDALYLCHWMRQSGLADLLPLLNETVWVGLSAGSMVMTPRIGDDFVGWKPPTGGDETLGIVDFSIFPHVDNEDLPWNTMANAERWAGGLSGPAYAIDDETAIKVVDGTVDVVSEGHWKLLTRLDEEADSPGALDWETVAFVGSAVAFRYPTSTPQGQAVERVDEQARDHRGDIERVHLSSPDMQELYVEVIRFRDLSPKEEYERHGAHLEQQFGEGSVTPLTETMFDERRAWTYGFRWADGERSVLSLEVDGDTYRILWNPRSELNSQVVATVVVGSEE